MKRIATTLMAGIALFFLQTTLYGQEKSTSIDVKITKESNGKTRVFEKTYESEEEMQRDPEYRAIVDETPPSTDQSLSLSGHRLFKIGEGADELVIKVPSGGFFEEDQVREWAEKWQFNLRNESREIERIIRQMELEIRDEDHGNLKEYLEELREALPVEPIRWHSFSGSLSKSVTVDPVEETDFDGMGKVDHKDKMELDDFAIEVLPESNDLRLKFSVNDQLPLKINFYDSNHNKVYEQYYAVFGGIYDQTISLGRFRDGAYLLEMQFGGKRFTKKLIVTSKGL